MLPLQELKEARVRPKRSHWYWNAKRSARSECGRGVGIVVGHKTRGSGDNVDLTRSKFEEGWAELQYIIYTKGQSPT
jgi:hypothetical protein